MLDVVSNACASIEDQDAHPHSLMLHKKPLADSPRTLTLMPIYRPFSFLKTSHASLSVLNTAPLIITCSVVAVVGNLMQS